MANEDNLKPFPKGVSGNPKGKKKGTKNTSTIIKDILNTKIDMKDPINGEKTKKEIRYAMIMKQVQRALGGNLNAYKELIDRIDGKPTQSIKQETTHYEGISDEEMKMLEEDAKNMGLNFNDYCRKYGIPLSNQN